ncbi:MAG: hypothetical protein JWN78_288 [Bacteroidota bacterium]|nr:hypothetical protein [Bacteroidota bacterium]
MNSKRMIGLLLTAIGIMGVIYTAAALTAGGHHHTVLRIIYIIAGVALCVSGIRMVRSTRENA